MVGQLSADDGNHMLFFLRQGYRVIAHDRRRNGRSTQKREGHDMDPLCRCPGGSHGAISTEKCIHVAIQPEAGEVAHLARHGESW